MVAVYHPDTRGVAHVPDDEWTLAHYAERGWQRVPHDVNLADPEAVAALFESTDRPSRRRRADANPEPDEGTTEEA